MIDVELVWMTGILGGILLIINFGTCMAMPWAKWLIGKTPLCSNHKPLAWLTIIVGIIHIVLGIMWYFGL